jgi:hypothetical protein
LQSLAISQTLPVSKAEDIEKQYTFCTKQDEEYAEKNIATDPMCNPVFGFIGSYLKSVDPEDVVDYLVAQNLINEEGEPIGDFVDFIETCMNSNTPLGEDIDLCLKGGGLSDKTFASDNPSSNSMLSEKALAAASIDELGEEDKKYAMMRLYCLDTSVDVDMNEGEGVSCSEEIAGGSADTPLNESVEFAGDGDLKKVIKASSPRKWAMIPAEHVCSLSERPNTENGGNIQIDARILPNLKYLASKYNMCVTAGLSGTHNSHGAGLGVDMVPKNGNSKSDWENSVEKAAKDIGWWGDGVNDPKGRKHSI